MLISNNEFVEKNSKTGTILVRGTKIAEEIIDKLKKQPKPKKFLAAFLIGNDSASISFLAQKEKVAKELGVDFRLYRYPPDIKQDPLRKEILKIISHKNCGGAIVQLPLPEHINKHYILNVIPREKDVDVLGERALGAFYAGRNSVLPPAVDVVQEIIRNLEFEIRNYRVAVVGLGFLVGKPITNWLMGKAKEIYLLDEGFNMLILKEAGLVISGVGKANLFSAENLKENALVIDFGFSKQIVNGKEQIVGDFNLEALNPSGYTLTYTPTPGGTGPILVAKLFENFYKLNPLTPLS